MSLVADTFPVLGGLSALLDLSAPFLPPQVSALSDQDLIDGSRQIAEFRRRADAIAATFAGEIAARSRRELGYAGLAAKRGARTPERLLQTLTGLSGRDATALVRVGSLMASLDDSAPATVAGDVGAPIWLREVAAAVSAGRISIDAANVIQVGLGEPGETVSTDVLTEAARALLRLAESLTVEKLAARAREVRDDIDTAGVAEREAALRSKRFLHLKLQSDGMTRISGLLDPESAATLASVIDAATSPRRGGPRFVRADHIDRAAEILQDDRTTEQIALDTLIDLVEAAAAADRGQILPVKRPEVQILVTERDYLDRTGFGRIHGQTESISIATVERNICETGILPILFDHTGQPLNLGRTQRLFSPAQRKAIAARDGGCLADGCDRPPAFCEVHHTEEWLRDRGRTDIREGVLLCKYHHLLVHNNGWKIILRSGEYLFVPPPDIDPRQKPIPARSKNPLMKRLVG